MVPNSLDVKEPIVTHTFTEAEASELYAEHKGKAFFSRLVAHTMSGPCILFMLKATDKGTDAVSVWREKMIAIRTKLASKTNLSANAVHGSDSAEASEREMAFFIRLLARKRMVKWMRMRSLGETPS